ncbi:MAG: HAD-IIIC family phosphatase, partial [Ruminiclostridium sp.]|nr:HAD-IIIC family phosphatase [Ruminiclostridium sp.]
MIMYESLIDTIKDKNTNNKGITFVINENESRYFSYNEIYSKSLGILYGLQCKGIKPGDELVFQIEDNQEFIFLFWACLLGGIIPVPVTVGNNDEHRLKLFKILEVLKKPNLITGQETLETLKRFADSKLPGKIKDNTRYNVILLDEFVNAKKSGNASASGIIYKAQPEDIAFIQFSSGSTGEPKGVVLTHENLLTNINAMISRTVMNSRDSMLSWMPLTHDMGLILVHLTGLAAGIDQYLMPTSLFIRHPLLWLEKAHQYKATQLYSPNFGFKHFMTYFNPEAAKHWDLSHVRLIYNGAEPISVGICNDFLDQMQKYGLKRNSMFTVYGLAEASVGVSSPPPGEEFVSYNIDRRFLSVGQAVKETDGKDNKYVAFVDVGSPIDDCYARIYDETSGVLSDNIVGYIQIKGKNVTNGYYNNSKATLEAFTEDGWLNTGDLGFMRDGHIIITGRAKDIVFINGQNYYPHDIERVAEDVDGIELGKAAACGVFNKEEQKEDIIVFVLFKKKLEDFVPLAINLKNHISKQMGLEIKEVIPIKKMPRTTSGKIQRYKLGEMYENGEFSDTTLKIGRLVNKELGERRIDNPENELEQKLVEIWEEVLGIKIIGINGSFFEMGGHSLKAANLISRIHKTFNVEIPLTEIFKNPTVKMLAEHIKQAEFSAYLPIVPAGEKEYYPVSSAQKRIFLINQRENIHTAYNIPVALTVEGALDKGRLERAFKALVKRHEALRTSFGLVDGEVVQRVHKDVDFEITYMETEEDNIKDVITDFIRPFDLKKAPLFRIGLVGLAKDRHILLLDMHHIISDGTSAGIFIKEFAGLYEDRDLPELRIQYKDFAVWEREQLKTGAVKKQEEYWLNAFSEGIPALSMPLDYKRQHMQSFEGSNIKFAIPIEVVEKLNRLSRKCNVTLNTLIFSIYNVLLSKYSGQEDIIVGSITAGRHHPDMDNLIGVFINFLPVKNKVKAGDTFAEFLVSANSSMLSAYENQDYPFDKIIENVSVRIDPSRNPIFDTMLIFHNEIDMSVFPEIDGLKYSRYELDSNTSVLDFKIDVDIGSSGELNCALESNVNLFRKKSMEEFIRHFNMLMVCIVNNPEQKLSEVELFTEGEKLQIAEKRTINTALYKSPLSMAVSATFVSEPVKDYIRWWCKQFDENVTVQFASYNQVFQELLDPNSLISTNTAVNLLLIRFEDLVRDDSSSEEEKCGKLERNFKELMETLENKKKTVPYFIGVFPVSTHLSGAMVNFLEDMNTRWKRVLAEIENVYIIDFTSLAELYNIQEIFDAVKDKAGHLPFSDEYYAAIGTEIARKICSWKKQVFKVIALDCDNTLWKGICGEDGASGVIVEEPYMELQKFMLRKNEEGMLLVLCSKNNEADVWEVFEKNTQMMLKKEHFAAWRVNWQSKMKNMKELADELNVGLDSFIYIDDNPVECSEIMMGCPEILTLQLPGNPKQISAFLQHIWAFDRFKVTEEDKKRTKMYTAEKRRQEAQNTRLSLAEFLKGLELKMSINIMEKPQLTRVAQLTQRTNQFNLSTIRRTEDEIEALICVHGLECRVIDVSDRFGDYG